MSEQMKRGWERRGCDRADECAAASSGHLADPRELARIPYEGGSKNG